MACAIARMTGFPDWARYNVMIETLARTAICSLGLPVAVMASRSATELKVTPDMRPRRDFPDLLFTFDTA